jgi:glycopeptide antibiotics resistance protein
MDVAFYLYRRVHAMIPGAMIALALFAALLPLRRRRLERLGLVSRPRRETVLALFWAYCGAMAAMLLFPPDFDLIWVLRYGYAGPFFRPGGRNLHLFQTLRYSKMIFAANVLLFLPFGFCPALLWRKSRWWKALLIAMAIPAVAENWQIHIGRSFDVDDLVLNTVGALLGWCLWLLCKKPSLTCEER